MLVLIYYSKQLHINNTTDTKNVGVISHHKQRCGPYTKMTKMRKNQRNANCINVTAILMIWFADMFSYYIFRCQNICNFNICVLYPIVTL